MKKSEKIMIGILVFILAIMCGVLFFIKTSQKQNVSADVSNQGNNQNVSIENDTKELGRVVRVNDKLYYDIGKESEHKLRCRSNGWKNSFKCATK